MAATAYIPQGNVETYPDLHPCRVLPQGLQALNIEDTAQAVNILLHNPRFVEKLNPPTQHPFSKILFQLMHFFLNVI